MYVSKSMEKTLNRMKIHEVRHARIEAEAANYIASQIRIIRQQRGMTQKALAKNLNTTQAAISRLEDPSYGRHSVQLLLAIGKVLDVALMVKFVPLHDLLSERSCVKEEALSVEAIADELVRVSYFTSHEPANLNHVVATMIPGIQNQYTQISSQLNDRAQRIFLGTAQTQTFTKELVFRKNTESVQT